MIKLMAIFSSETIGYQEACNLIKQLQIAGIEASITNAGISISCAPDQVNNAEAICKELGASFDAGYTSHEVDKMVLSKDGYDKLAQITDDAIAVIKEWK
jgi:hypothetical protein